MANTQFGIRSCLINFQLGLYPVGLGVFLGQERKKADDP